jgi:hypothetical protein
MVMATRKTVTRARTEADGEEAMMKSDGDANPWQVLNTVSQRISQGFGVCSDSPSSPQSESASLEEISRRMVEEQLAGADIKPISSWLRQS